MADPFLSEIRIMSFGFPPKGWALCNGQLLPINQNQALFSLLGTTYGGNGQTNFGLPDLQGRTPIHMGSGHSLGERGGEQGHTLSISELPTHVHVASASPVSDSSNVAIPTGNFLASPLSQTYTPAAALGAMIPSTIGNVGGSQAHLNMQPFLTLNFCIALQGIFPSQN
ncbi:MAG: phage tail protein [Proteobacteria bacterium]|nr:phage tail protein [Pseudomonadota bacterium]MCE7951008.1 phage tail protein [Xanthomonadales bacterium PRO7]